MNEYLGEPGYRTSTAVQASHAQSLSEKAHVESYRLNSALLQSGPSEDEDSTARIFLIFRIHRGHFKIAISMALWQHLSESCIIPTCNLSSESCIDWHVGKNKFHTQIHIIGSVFHSVGLFGFGDQIKSPSSLIPTGSVFSYLWSF